MSVLFEEKSQCLAIAKSAPPPKNLLKCGQLLLPLALPNESYQAAIKAVILSGTKHDCGAKPAGKSLFIQQFPPLHK